MSRFGSTPEDKHDLSTRAGLEAAERAADLEMSQYIEIREKMEAACAAIDAELDQIDHGLGRLEDRQDDLRKRRAELIRSEGYEYRLQPRLDQMMFFKHQVRDAGKGRPAMKLVLPSGTIEISGNPDKKKVQWVDDEAAVDLLAESDLPDVVLEQMAPVPKRRVLGDKKEIKKAFGEDGKTCDAIDSKTGEVVTVTLPRALYSHVAAPIPYTYDIIASDGTRYEHDSVGATPEEDEPDAEESD